MIPLDPSVPERAGASDAQRESSERIELLLSELERTSSPASWSRVQELVERMVDLYGRGLTRIVAHAVDPSALTRLCDDELVSSLLLLHGLHPHSTRERIERALAEVRPYLGSHAGDVELVDLDDEGRAQLRLSGTCRGCPSSRATVEGMIRRAVEEAAPELTGVEVEGVAAAPAPKPSARWSVLEGVLAPRVGERRAIEIEGVEVLLLGGAAGPLAYRNHCPGCSARLDGASVAGDAMTCAACGLRFDVAHAGRALSPGGKHLQPLPLLVKDGALRISISGARS